MAVQIESPTLLSYFELQASCQDRPEEVQVLVQTSGVNATPNFRPRYDSRYLGWTQFVVEGLSNGQRAVLLVEPRSLSAPLTADLRLVLPGSPASAVMQLTCSAI